MPAPAVGLQRLQEESAVMVQAGETTMLFTLDEAGGSAQAFDAFVKEKAHSFEISDAGELVDRETKSTWNRVTGEAVAGTLKGEKLRAIPGTISFRKAWKAFYPDDEIH